ncbi:helix-turn-helix domain-containing protein [Streptomyces sp. ACA25]|uniref:winged helix-turn-helix transcriptional regulator n=1 Tax=Streptomyces sp. ACA25 TaxID=3022596 RepID=UPI0023074377|nr:helix-turn-helix domain-containing protein [Streptomyces sp. ACA25]MDB1086307.1 helix-turn-helix domain-containing protein [Streptomyces sp. ACA25]
MADEVADPGQGSGEVGVIRPGSGLLRVFQLLGKRWTGLVVASLMHGPRGFAELRRGVSGISERMLSDRLTELAEAGLLVREVTCGPPVRVTYRLTEAGHGLRPAMVELTRWAELHLPQESGFCPGEFRG